MPPKPIPAADTDLDLRSGRKLDPIDLAVGAQLRALRAREGMSMEVLARTVGVTYQQIQKYEKGTNRVSISMLCRLAAALHADPANIVSTAVTRKPPPAILPEMEVFARKASSLSPRARRELVALVDAIHRSGAGVR